MTEPKIYSLHLSKSTKVGFVLLLSGLTAFVTLLAFGEGIWADWRGWSLYVLLVGLLGVCWYGMLSLPQTVVHHPDDTLEFQAPLRTHLVAIANLRTIEPVPNQIGTLRIRHSAGEIYVINQFNGFQELITDIKATNPSVEIRC